MKSTIAALLMLLLLPVLSFGQTTITVPVPPPTAPPPVAFNQTVSSSTTTAMNDTVTINGVSYQRTGSLTTVTTGTLTLTPSPSGSSGSAPAVTSVLASSSGAAIATAAGGSQVTLVGTGFGAGGTVTIAGQAVTTQTWTSTSIIATLPKPAAAVTGPVVVTPTGGQPITSSFQFSITVASASLPADPQPWLFISGFSDMNENSMPGQVKTGEKFIIEGHDFGEQSTDCRVEVNYEKAGIVSWLDNLIVAEAPGLPEPAHQANVLVWRDPQHYELSMASFRLVPATP